LAMNDPETLALIKANIMHQHAQGLGVDLWAPPSRVAPSPTPPSAMSQLADPNLFSKLLAPYKQTSFDPYARRTLTLQDAEYLSELLGYANTGFKLACAGTLSSAIRGIVKVASDNGVLLSLADVIHVLYKK
jgi:hypothetical protein